MNPSESLKKVKLVIPGHTKRLSTLRERSIKALKNWDVAQRKKHISRNRELLLKKSAANALEEYSKAIVEEEEKKEYIGTAQNMSGHYLPTNTTINYKPNQNLREKYQKNKSYRNLQRSRENANEANKGLSGIGLNENLNRMFNFTRGGRRWKTMKNRKV
jgi:hypothetical protein